LHAGSGAGHDGRPDVAPGWWSGGSILLLRAKWL